MAFEFQHRNIKNREIEKENRLLKSIYESNIRFYELHEKFLQYNNISKFYDNDSEEGKNYRDDCISHEHIYNKNFRGHILNLNENKEELHGLINGNLVDKSKYYVYLIDYYKFEYFILKRVIYSFKRDENWTVAIKGFYQIASNKNIYGI